MTDSPTPLPPPADRAAWKRLARLAETPERPEGWKVHRPGLAVFVLGLVVFGTIGGVCLVVTIAEGPLLCPVAGAAIFLTFAGFCVANLVLAPRQFVLLAPEWIFVGRPVASPLLLAWTEVGGVDLSIAKNPRQTRETHGSITIRRVEGEPVRIGGFEPDHLRVVHEEMRTYWQAASRS